MNAWTIVAVLVTSVSAAAVAVITHQYRQNFIALQEEQSVQAELAQDWGQLQLEENALAAHGRVERDAKRKLGMRPVASEEVEVLQVPTQ